MLGLFSSRRTRSPSQPNRNRARLGVERLEARDCPTAPYLNLTVAPLHDTSVLLSGMLMDTYAAGATVTFGGEVSGSTTTDSFGHYSYQTNAAAVGPVTAVAVDSHNLTSNVATAPIVVQPLVVSLSIIKWTGSKQIYVSGGIQDETPFGLTVTFSGAATGTTTSIAGGWYNSTLNLTQLGTLTASVTDAWGLSGGASVNVTKAAPTVKNVSATQESFIWFIAGQVTDVYPTGMVVTSQSTNSNLNGTGTADANGNFTIQLPGTQYGTINISATDAWGKTSNVVTEMLI